MFRDWKFPGLTLKLLVALVGTMALISGGQGLFFTLHHQRDMEHLVNRSADRIAEVVRRSTRSSMLRNNREQLQEIMDTVAAEPGMGRLRIFDKEGRIRYSNSPEELGTLVSKKSPGCIACHAGAKAKHVSGPERFRIFREADGSRTLGVILPIPNEPACYQGDCHAHRAEDRLLGVLDVNMTLRDVDQAMRDAAFWRLVALVATVVLVALIVVLFILIWVNRPLRHLMEGTYRVAQGDLEHSIPVTSRDEMGMLAVAFNDMTRRLRESMQVIRHWNDTLQRRVEEKTEELGQAHRQILRVERMATLGKLAAIIAHEINNPLSGIRTYAKLLMKRGAREGRAFSDDDIRCLGLIESEAARCGDIVRGLLEFSRKSPLRLQLQDINRLVDESIRLVRHRLDLQGVEVKIDLAPDLPEISCSGQQVVQVLIAILINACEAMPKEGTLSVSTGPDEGGGICIRIQDTGVGMDEQTLEHIFEPFFSTKEDAHGVGLGLAVVYGIVQRHGGRIDVTSRLREGTTFILHFPPEPPPELAKDMLEDSGA